MRKRNKTLLTFFIGIFLFAGLLLFNHYGPYNVFDAINANNLATFPELQKQLDGKILNIKYIGRDKYQVHTDKKDYIIVKYNSNDVFLRFKVFDLNKKIEIFLNPM